MAAQVGVEAWSRCAANRLRQLRAITPGYATYSIPRNHITCERNQPGLPSRSERWGGRISTLPKLQRGDPPPHPALCRLQPPPLQSSVPVVHSPNPHRAHRPGRPLPPGRRHQPPGRRIVDGHPFWWRWTISLGGGGSRPRATGVRRCLPGLRRKRSSLGTCVCR